MLKNKTRVNQTSQGKQMSQGKQASQGKQKKTVQEKKKKNIVREASTQDNFVTRATKVTNPKNIPHTAQDSIPYLRTYDAPEGQGGIIETELGVFSKSYIIADANFAGEDDERQDEILSCLTKALNTFKSTCSYELTTNVRTTNIREFAKTAMYDYTSDGYDNLRKEHNRMISDKMTEGKNNLRTEIYLTIAVSAASAREAQNKLSPMEMDISSKIKKINNEGMRPLSLAERLEIIYDVCNLGHEGEFMKVFNPSALLRQGLSTKDVVAPSSFITKDSDHIQMGDTYARTLYLKTEPANIGAGMFRSLSSISSNVLVSLHYMPFEQAKAVAYARNQVTMLGGEVGKSQKNLSKSGMSFELVPQSMKAGYESAQKMLDDLSTRDQRLFNLVLVVMVLAKSEEELNAATEQVLARARENVCLMDVYAIQEQGFIAALPLARCPVPVKHTETSEIASAYQPFLSSESWSRGGEYYGLNALTKNIIILNRLDALNQNGCILGVPGSGKSFAAKLEMYQAFLAPAKSQIFILDPENEYSLLTEKLGGEVIQIKPGGQNHINPMDLNMAQTKDDDADPFAQKEDFIFSIIVLMLGGRAPLNGSAISMLDSILKELYQPYIDHLRRARLYEDKETCPTLRDLYDRLMREDDNSLAHSLAENIQIYCTGTMNLFSHKTNVDLNAKVICYDLSNIGSQLQNLGMQICLQDMWNRMKSNRKKEIRTWLYVDEAHLFLAMPSTASFLQTVWKRARKWYGTPTFITQQVNDMLTSPEGQTILSTSDFTLMLKQDRLDREELARLYNISEEMQEYITDGNAGDGLIYNGKTIIPFENHYPTDTELYKIMSTKPGEEEDDNYYY